MYSIYNKGKSVVVERLQIRNFKKHNLQTYNISTEKCVY